MKTAIDNKVFSGTKEVLIDKISNQCVEYNAKPNFINTIGNHLAKNINLVLPKNLQKPQETEKSNQEPTKSSSSGLFGFGKYIYNKVGSVVNKLSEKSGITSVFKQIEEHSLKNFEKINLDSVTWKVSGYENGKLEIEIKSSEIDKIENIKSTGNEIAIHYKKEGIDNFTILGYKEFALNDLIGLDIFENFNSDFNIFNSTMGSDSFIAEIS